MLELLRMKRRLLIAITISIGGALHSGVIRVAAVLVLRLIRVGTVCNRMSRVARRTVSKWVSVAICMTVLLVGLVDRITHVLPLIMAGIIVVARRVSIVIVQANLLDLAVVLVYLLTSLLLLQVKGFLLLFILFLT